MRRPSRAPRDKDRAPGGPSLAGLFRVTIGGVEVPVARVEGLALAADPAGLEARRGPDGSVVWSAPPLPVRVTLARAVDGDRSLFAWRQEALRDGEKAARPVAIRATDGPGGRARAGWALLGWPLAWSGPALDANAAGLAWETLEIVADDLTWLDEEEEEGDGDQA